MFIASGGRRYPAAPTPSFPLKVSGNGRYLIDANLVPFPLLQYQAWSLPCVSSTSDRNSIVTKLQSLGINTLWMYAITADGPAAGSGGTWNGKCSPDRNGNLPFLKNQSAGTWDGTLTTADVTTPDLAGYWTTITTDLAYYASQGIFCLLFPAYLGFFSAGNSTDGIGNTMINCGSTSCGTFGQKIAQQITGNNVGFLAYGDTAPSVWPAGMTACHNAFWNNFVSNATQSPLIIGGHFGAGNGIPTSPNNTDSPVNGYVKLNTCYLQTSGSDDSPAFSTQTTACQQSPILPSYCGDSAMYEGDPFDSPITNTPKDLRKRWWWSALSGSAGVMWGNELCTAIGSPVGASGTFTYANMNVSTGLGSDGHKHLGIGATIFKALPWWLLLPANTYGMSAIITSGQGSGQSWLQSAADRAGSVCAVYVPPSGAATFSVDMTIMGGPAAALWVDPSNGAITTIASPQSPLPNTGTHSFTTPGNNAYGDPDWVLLLLGPNTKMWW